MQRFISISRFRPVSHPPITHPLLRYYADMSAPSAAETDTQAQAAANSSGITTDTLQKTLTEKLDAKHVDVEDMSGTSSGAAVLSIDQLT